MLKHSVFSFLVYGRILNSAIYPYIWNTPCRQSFHSVELNLSYLTVSLFFHRDQWPIGYVRQRGVSQKTALFLADLKAFALVSCRLGLEKLFSGLVSAIYEGWDRYTRTDLGSLNPGPLSATISDMPVQRSLCSAGCSKIPDRGRYIFFLYRDLASLRVV